MPETIFVRNQQEAARAMQQVVNQTVERMRRVTHRAVFADEILPKLRRWHREYFERSAGPSGRPWAPLSQVTVDRKGHDTILIETGDLVTSLVEQNRHTIKRFRREGSKVVFEYGTDRPNAWRHQQGTPRIPQREHVGIDNTKLDAIVAALADNAVRQLKASETTARMAG